MPVNHLPQQVFSIWDKAQHAAGFAMLSTLCLKAYPGGTTRVILGLALYGIFIEVAQHLSGWRTGDPLDWLADMVGVITTVLAFACLPKPADRINYPD